MQKTACILLVYFMQKIYWKGISNDERIKAIREITDIINKHGTILNFQKFSDAILSLIIEMDYNKVNSLHKSLSHILSLEGDDHPVPDSPVGCILFLHVTFSKGTGDLEIEVPNIPV